jgi:hypothetical protein
LIVPRMFARVREEWLGAWAGAAPSNVLRDSPAPELGRNLYGFCLPYYRNA